MRRIIKKLPKHAKYDYRDIFGDEHYHTANRCYTLEFSEHYGHKIITIVSEKR